MDGSKVLATVCVLTLMAGHVSGQVCVQSMACFGDLDIYGWFGILSVGKICRKTDEVTRCYSEFVSCPELTNISSALPGNSSVQEALVTFCKIKGDILPCVVRSPSLLLNVLGCITSLADTFLPGEQQLDDQHSDRTLDRFITCLSDAFKVCGDKKITSSFESIETIFQQDLHPSPSSSQPTARPQNFPSTSSLILPSSQPSSSSPTRPKSQTQSPLRTRPQRQPSTPSPKQSGCVKTESWPFLGVIATLISSGVKRF